MNQMLAFFLIVLVIAAGEIIATRTKARIPSLFVAAILLIVGFWVVFPKDLLDKSGLPMLVTITTPIIITSMGTIMSLKQIEEQWRALVVGFGTVVGIGLFLLTIYRAIYGLPIAVAAAAPISGGLVAALIGENAMKAIGRPELGVLCVLFFVLQQLIGLPLMANVLRRYVTKNLDKINTKKETPVEEAINPAERKLFPPLPKVYQTSFVLLAKVTFVAWLAYVVGGLTHGVINVSIIAIIFGLIAYAIGFLEGDILTKSGTMTFFTLLLIVACFGPLNQATPQLLLSFIGPIILGFVFGIAGMVIVSLIVGKLIGLDWELSIAVSCTALDGFPFNYLVVQEVAKGMARNEEERKAIVDRILPTVIVGGYATVTIGSVIFASIITRFL